MGTSATFRNSFRSEQYKKLAISHLKPDTFPLEAACYVTISNSPEPNHIVQLNSEMAALALALVLALVVYSSGQTDYQTAGLNSHNTFRAKHRSVPMKLDSSLNTAAQNCAVTYATKRAIDHSCTTPNAGENLFSWYGYTTAPQPVDITIQAIQAWYDENKLYNYQNPGSTDFYKIGHFTQLVWNASTLLGIGVSSISNYTVVVGKYMPWGNMMGGGADGYDYFRQNVFPPIA